MVHVVFGIALIIIGAAIGWGGISGRLPYMIRAIGG